MACFHLCVKSISRGKGHSAVEAAAYRLGAKFKDERLGVTHNYTKKRGVLLREVLAPPGAPAWALDPEALWNRLEANEKRANARVGREFVVALPHELTQAQNEALARDIARLVVERYETAAQIAVHAPDKGGDQRNVHLHLMFCPRVVGPEGFGPYTAKAYDDFKQGPAEISLMRERVAGLINTHLERAGNTARVDPRALEAQHEEAVRAGDLARARETDRFPTVKEGRAKGQKKARSAQNRRIRESNEARQRKWDMWERKARKEARLMEPYIEEKTHERTQGHRGDGTHAPRARTPGAPLTHATLRRYHDASEAPHSQPVPQLRASGDALPLKSRWGTKRAGGLLPSHEQGHRSVREGVHPIRPLRWKRASAPLAPTTPQPSIGSTKSTAHADHYGRERMRIDDEALRAQLEELAKWKRQQHEREKALAMTEQDVAMSVRMFQGTTPQAKAWAEAHWEAVEKLALAERLAKERRLRPQRVAEVQKRATTAVMEYRAWEADNPRPSLGDPSLPAWEAERQAKRQALETLRVRYRRIQAMAEPDELKRLAKEESEARLRLEQAMQRRQKIAPLPSEVAAWNAFRFPNRPAPPPPEHEAGLAAPKPAPFPYPVLRPPWDRR